MKEMNELIHRLMRGQLEYMGVLAGKDAEIARSKTKLRLNSLYERWLEESIQMLRLSNRSSSGTNPVDMDATWRAWEEKKEAWLGDSDMKAYVVLIDATLKALPEILAGKIPATDILFPDSSMRLVEGIYKNNTVSDYFNEVLTETITAYMEERLEREPTARIRIIEIGAGTGGTSAGVFRKLKPYREHIQEYCYTDISKAFLIHAEKEYGRENPYLTYEIFNVEMPAAGQKVSIGGYDIAIAANVLHATKNIRQTLRNTKAILRKNGLVLLNEISRNNLFAHLTFGLLEGWWLYEDQELRIPGCPGLYPETWRVVLGSEGFHSIFFPAEKMHDLGQQIIVAGSDGVVRQKQAFKPAVLPVNRRTGAKVLEKRHPSQKPPNAKAGGASQELLKEKAAAYIKKTVGEILRIPVGRIDSSMPLEKYGLDSILVIQLFNAFRKVLDNVSSTLLFEYPTIDALVEHFIKTQKDSLSKLVGFEEQVVEEVDERLEAEYTTPALRKTGYFLPRSYNEKTETREQSNPVVQDAAITGLSGRYPEAANANDKPMMSEQKKSNPSDMATMNKFPELIHLNQCTQGRPIFWFHGGLGGVEIYKVIAKKSRRPFYGIQARGWMTNRAPINGIEAMALYYVHIIQSIQPEGPYDLGGYSLGGVLSYEITRQLQEMGQCVNTIVMLDSIYNDEIRKMKISQKALILQAVNMALLSTIQQEPEKIARKLIHRDELNPDLEEEQYLNQLVTLARKRGLTKTKAQLREFIQQCTKAQQAYGTGDYSVLPMSDPGGVTCYYFRNRSGLLYGELEPYFLTAEDKAAIVSTDHWRVWEKNLPNFHRTDVESSNHMMLLSEPKPSETIFAFCEELYAEEGNAGM